MRVIVQRVVKGKVTVGERTVGEIGKGCVLLLGIGKEDEARDIAYLVEKIMNLRIFEDETGKMNISLLDIRGELLVVSQFTLYGDCRKGKRPSYDKAARPEVARELYESFVRHCKEYGIKVETGEFQAMMKVEIHNDGPVTLLLDSKREF